MKIDYTDIRSQTMILNKAMTGVNPSFFDTTDILYFDETGNCKKFTLRANAFNNDADTHFVLGGVEAKTTATFDELKAIFHLQDNVVELKSTSVFRGAFEDITRHRHLADFLKFIKAKGWHIHYTVMNALYYSLVDIVDSINKGFESLSFHHKSMLYNLMREDVTGTASLLSKYNYPDLKDEDVVPFCNDMIVLFDMYVKNLSDKNLFMLALSLKEAFLKAKSIGKLTFIQDEEGGVLIDKFSQFYLNKLYMFPFATLIFDNEATVQEQFKTTKVEVYGKEVNNYTMVDSKTEPMTQVCDVVVAIISRYMKFLDCSRAELQAKVDAFEERQLTNLKLLNRLINDTLEYNPVLLHYISPLSQKTNLDYLAAKYNATDADFAS